MAAAAPKQQVVILGGGYLGVHTAKHLDSANTSKRFEITLVSPREGFLLHKIASLRAAAMGKGSWVDRALVPTANVFAKNKSGKFVRGTAVAVHHQNATNAGNMVELEDGTQLPFDILIIATGSNSNSPGEPPANVTSLAQTKQHFLDFQNELAESKSVVIVGAGPVGLELAGEIRAAYGKAIEIQVVAKSSEILAGQTPLARGGIQSARRLIESLDIKLVLGDEIVGEEFAQVKWAKTPQGVELKSGKKIACDFLVSAVGVQVRTEFLPAHWLDAESKEVLIDPETFLVKGTANVFSAGDVAKTGFTKLGYVAMEDSKILAKNVLQALDKRTPTNRVVRPKVGMMVLTAGPNHGRVILPALTLGDFMTKMVKSRGLFAQMIWGALNAGKPPKA